MSLDWKRDAQDWPLSQYSRFIDVEDQTLHVQILGAGPIDILCLHGAGASTHSFKDLAPELALWARVIVPDLPGHAFSRARPGQALGLAEISNTLHKLMLACGARPQLVVAHSAGAAVACRMTLDDRIDPKGLILINPAVEPFRGVSALVFPWMARKVASSSWISGRIAQEIRRYPSWVRRTVRATGSDSVSAALYQRLATDEQHVTGVVRMMAQWDLRDLFRQVSRIAIPVKILVGDEDRAVPPAQGLHLAQRLIRGSALQLSGLGHLAHEEAPSDTARLVRQFSQALEWEEPS